MEKGETRHENTHIKRMKNKQNRTSNTLNSHSVSTEKKKTAKEHILKIKTNKRPSNVKEFQGRRHDSREINAKSIWLETGKEALQKPIFLFNEKPVIILTKNKSNQSTELVNFTQPFLETNKTSPTEVNNDSVQWVFSFDDHMAQWAEQLCKPFILPSTNIEFDIPYCYSEEFYSKLSANCYMMQPFSSIEEPVLMWNSYVDVWHEKAQLALQFYRQLCVQPSRVPMQMITIKRSVAQFVAEQCALLGTELYFEAFEDSSIVETSIAVEGKKKESVYIFSDDSVRKKLDADDSQGKTDNSIYTESWQN